MSTEHNPEFTMLEFYEAYATYMDLMDLTETLFAELARELTGGLVLPWGEYTIDLTPPWTRLTVERTRSRSTPGSTAPDVDDVAKLRTYAATHGIPASRRRALRQGPDRALREDRRGETHPTDFHHRISRRGVAARALVRRDPAIVDRFELFIGGASSRTASPS
jgi:lysyl-tRNA synthetase class 2